MKKAILVVSFGTSHLDALNNSIKKIEDSIQENFKEYDVLPLAIHGHLQYMPQSHQFSHAHSFYAFPATLPSQHGQCHRSHPAQHHLLN